MHFHLSGSEYAGISFFLLSFKKIVLRNLIKVDWQVSRVHRDKYPVYLWILIKYLLRIVYEHKRPQKEGMSFRSLKLVIG